MRRRDFIKAIAGSAIAWPLTARAQQDQRVRRIGVLLGDFPENAPEARAVVAAFQEELQKLGWAEGRNIRIDSRWAAADIEAMQRFAKEAPFRVRIVANRKAARLLPDAALPRCSTLEMP